MDRKLEHLTRAIPLAAGIAASLAVATLSLAAAPKPQVLLQFRAEAAEKVTRTEKGKTVTTPVFQYAPRADLVAGLQRSGVVVTTSKTSPHDLVLFCVHEERMTEIYGRPKPVTVFRIEIVLLDREQRVLLAESYGPFGEYPYTPVSEGKRLYSEVIPGVVGLRAAIKDDTEFYAARLKKFGFHEKTVNLLADTKSSQAATVLVPLLGDPDLHARMVVREALERSGYSGATERERALVALVSKYPFARWDLTSVESSAAAWATRQGFLPVVEFGTTAIDILIEDLRCDRNILRVYYGVDDGGVATRAKAVLQRLRQDRWKKFGIATAPSGYDIEFRRGQTTEFVTVGYIGSFGSPRKFMVEVVNPTKAAAVFERTWKEEWNQHALSKLTSLLEDAPAVKVGDYLVVRQVRNRTYFEDIIDILGKIGTAETIPQLDRFTGHKELGGAAKKALEELRSGGKSSETW